jgi:hypothetical protein
MAKRSKKGEKKGRGTDWPGPRVRAWTATEVRELKALARKKMPAAKTTHRLKRTEGGARQKAFSIRLSLGGRRGTSKKPKSR